MTIQVTTGSYGFGHEWTLNAYGRNFYLGQDVKFCSRVLGMSPSYLVREIGTNRFDTEAGRKKLAKYICSTLGINRRTIKQYQPWSLCAQ